MVYDHQENRGENAIMQLVMIDNNIMSSWLQIGDKIVRGKMILLPRLFRGYRGNFPAAPVESAPMQGRHYSLQHRFLSYKLQHLVADLKFSNDVGKSQRKSKIFSSKILGGKDPQN